MSTKNIITYSAKETQNIAKEFAKKILSKNYGKRALVLALRGDLGSGKTTFLQGFAKGLGIKEKVLSPTFMLVKRFAIKDKKFKNFYHIDCYRLDSEKDSRVLGFKDIILNPENIIAIEWPERVDETLPKNAIKIRFIHIGENVRMLKWPKI